MTNIRKVSAEVNLPCLSTDDFEQFIGAKRIKTNAIDQLSLALCSITNEMPDDGEYVIILLRCVKYQLSLSLKGSASFQMIVDH